VTATKARSCDGKQRYDTRRAAEGDRFKRMRQTGASPVHLVSYKCGFCGGWHLGHPVRKNGRRK
jgi:hypothetical protein